MSPLLLYSLAGFAIVITILICWIYAKAVMYCYRQDDLARRASLEAQRKSPGNKPDKNNVEKLG